MAANNYSCDIRQGYNFEKDSQETVGHVNSLSIGGTAFAADTGVTVPTDMSTAKVVGVISSFSWEGGYADPLYLTFNVSIDNKTTASTLKHTSLSKTDTEISFTIYQYDPKEKVFYKAFHTNDAAIKCLVNKSGGKLDFDISDYNDTTVESPLNYPLPLAVMPQASQQELQMATSNTQKLTKQFGVGVG